MLGHPKENTQHTHPKTSQGTPMRRCPAPRCPHLTPNTYCEHHTKQNEKRRGTAHARGYGTKHQTLRATHQAAMHNGTTYTCPHCHTPIHPDQPWDLGHTPDRATWTGPEHAHCNRADGGRRSTQHRKH
jgi:hypothetical protein